MSIQKKKIKFSANSKPLGVFCNSKVEDRLIRVPGQLSRSSQQDIFSEFTIVKWKGPPLVNLKEIFLTQLKRVFKPFIRLLSTVCKIHNFSVTQILREINFGESSSCKTAVLPNSWALNFVNLVNISLQKVQKFIKITIHSL